MISTRPEAIGRRRGSQYDLVRAQAELSTANGVNTDLELALFDADHGDPEVGARAPRARSGTGATACTWPTRSRGPCT